jgi:hypothetical protein
MIDLSTLDNSFRLFRSPDAPRGRDPNYFEYRGNKKFVQDQPVIEHIYPYSSTHLAVYVVHSKTIKRAAKHGAIRQRGDDEATVIFTPDKLDKIAKIISLRKKRKLSDDQRHEASLRLARWKINNN